MILIKKLTILKIKIGNSVDSGICNYKLKKSSASENSLNHSSVKFRQVKVIDPKVKKYSYIFNHSASSINLSMHRNVIHFLNLASAYGKT